MKKASWWAKGQHYICCDAPRCSRVTSFTDPVVPDLSSGRFLRQLDETRGVMATGSGE